MNLGQNLSHNHASVVRPERSEGRSNATRSMSEANATLHFGAAECAHAFLSLMSLRHFESSQSSQSSQRNVSMESLRDSCRVSYIFSFFSFSFCPLFLFLFFLLPGPEFSNYRAKWQLSRFRTIQSPVVVKHGRVDVAL